MNEADRRALAAIDAKTRLDERALPGLRPAGGGRRRLRGAEGEATYHHVMSRMTDGPGFWDEVEREALARLLWKLAGFCGLEILTYCVMGNHFHALVRVPDRDAWLRRFSGSEGEEVLYRQLERLYSRGSVGRLRATISALRARGRGGEAEQVLAAFRERFANVSVWAKEVKERFAKWLNRRRGRRGILWMERFKDVLVEDGEALRTMAAYIDLNPVRAGLVGDPSAYPWSGWGEVRRGLPQALQSLRDLLEAGGGPVGGLVHSVSAYAGWLAEAGGGGEASEGPVGVAAAGVPLGAALRMRVRSLTDGLALGRAVWVERVFAGNRRHFGPKRRTGARRLAGVETGLCSLRALRVNAIGPPGGIPTTPGAGRAGQGAGHG